MDDSILEVGKEMYKEDVYEYLIDGIRNGIEFVFCILMLKKINNQYTFSEHLITCVVVINGTTHK